MDIEQELTRSAPERDTLLTIGVFDGVHSGHRYLLERLKERAQEKKLLSGVVTFTPHPQSILRPENNVRWLSDLSDRVQQLEGMGIGIVVPLSFTPELSRLSAREFIALLKQHLRMQGLMVGPDFALGKGRQGTLPQLRSLGREMGFTVEAVRPYAVKGEVASSTLIRQVLAEGDMPRAARLMGHLFYLRDTVSSADRRGRTLGYPTANLGIKPYQALPGDGIYATITHADGRRFPSATNIGTRPTFGNGPKTVETHVIGYDGELYGKEIKVEFVEKLRDEQRFESAEELKGQIKEDIEQAKTLLRDMA